MVPVWARKLRPASGGNGVGGAISDARRVGRGLRATGTEHAERRLCGAKELHDHFNPGRRGRS